MSPIGTTWRSCVLHHCGMHQWKRQATFRNLSQLLSHSFNFCAFRWIFFCSESAVLASAFRLSIVRGMGSLSPLTLWRQRVQNSDTQAVRFQFTVFISSAADTITVWDGVSAQQATIAATSDPDDGRFLNCPQTLILPISSLITCQFMAIGSSLQVQTFASRFAITVADSSGAMGNVSAINPILGNVISAVNNSASNSSSGSSGDVTYTFSFTYRAPSSSVSTSLTFTVFYPAILGGGPMTSRSIPVLVTDTPDSTSLLSCGSLASTFDPKMFGLSDIANASMLSSGASVTAYAPAVCTVSPRKNGRSINALASLFAPRVLSGPASIFNELAPSAGSALAFSVRFTQSYQTYDHVNPTIKIP